MCRLFRDFRRKTAIEQRANIKGKIRSRFLYKRAKNTLLIKAL